MSKKKTAKPVTPETTAPAAAETSTPEATAPEQASAPAEPSAPPETDEVAQLKAKIAALEAAAVKPGKKAKQDKKAEALKVAAKAREDAVKAAAETAEKNGLKVYLQEEAAALLDDPAYQAARRQAYAANKEAFSKAGVDNFLITAGFPPYYTSVVEGETKGLSSIVNRRRMERRAGKRAA